MSRTKNFERNEVLDKAIQLFWKKGFADTSLQDLEKATGVNKSGLYSEFKDKEDLFIASLNRYGETHPALKILSQAPMGWVNIKNFLKLGPSCQGQKGCYLANTMRETSVVPARAKTIISQSVGEIRNSLIENLKKTKTSKDVNVLAAMILTLNSGFSLKLNLIAPEIIEKEIDEFVELLKR